jgi:hypothetical protein
MEQKENYLKKVEFKVKNLLTDIYQTELNLMKEIGTTKEKLNRRIKELENRHTASMRLRQQIQEKLTRLKDAGKEEWDMARYEFELLLDYLQEDKKRFLETAENLLTEFTKKIREMEKQSVDKANAVEPDHDKRLQEMQESRSELEAKIQKIRKKADNKISELKDIF